MPFSVFQKPLQVFYSNTDKTQCYNAVAHKKTDFFILKKKDDQPKNKISTQTVQSDYRIKTIQNIDWRVLECISKDVTLKTCFCCHG